MPDNMILNVPKTKNQPAGAIFEHEPYQMTCADNTCVYCGLKLAGIDAGCDQCGAGAEIQTVLWINKIESWKNNKM